MGRTGPGVIGRRATLVGIATALFLVVAVLTISARYEPLLHTPRHNPAGLHVPVTPTLTPRTEPTVPDASSRSTSHSHLLEQIFLVLLLLFAIALAVALLTALAQWVRHVRVVLGARRQLRHRAEAPIPDVLGQIRHSIDQSRRGIELGAPRDAIIDCWIRLEDTVQEAGVPLRASETSAELVLRVIDTLDADSGALSRLGVLYRRARFSSHPIEEGDRLAAREALTALLDSMPEGDHEGSPHA